MSTSKLSLTRVICQQFEASGMLAPALSYSPGELPRGFSLKSGPRRRALAKAAELPEQPCLDRVQFGITSFNRPGHLTRLVQSIQQRYPEAAIIIADNGTEKAALPESVEVMHLPIDCGLSAARNALIDRLDREFLILLEEDFLFGDRTRIGDLVSVADAEPWAGFVGGSLIQSGTVHRGAVNFEVIRDRVSMVQSQREIKFTAQGVPYQFCDMVFNFGLARREFLAEHRWLDWLKLGEHFAFFWDLYQRRHWQVAIAPSCCAVHDQGGRSNDYKVQRSRAEEYHVQYMQQKKISLDRRRGQPRWWISPLVSEPPSILLLGVGHVGTTIATRMLAALGWNLGDADQEYAESVSARRLNESFISSGEFDFHRAVAVMRKLPEPWVLKDPRFLESLPHWLPIFGRMLRPPLLILLTRDLRETRRSYKRRGETVSRSDHRPGTRGRTVPELHALAQARYESWPWQKITIDYDQVSEAAGLFQPRLPERA